MLYAKITGIGKCLPDKILNNGHLEKIVETSDQWITERTGIRERRIVEMQTPSDLATEAALSALDDSGLSADKIDLILVATVRGDFHFPSCACIVQKNIQASKAAALDINAGCTGFIYGLDMAKAYIQSGLYKKILLIGVEVLSKITDYTDRQTCILFGDGAGAVIIENSDTEGIIASKLYSDGTKGNLLYCENTKEGKEFLRMEGNKVFRLAVEGMVEASSFVLKLADIEKEQLDLIVPHQANSRIIFKMAEILGIPRERIFMTIEKYGNTSSATIPIALKEAQEEERLQKGKLGLLTAFGAGFTWGATLIKW